MSAGIALMEHIRGEHLHSAGKRWNGRYYDCTDCRPGIVFAATDLATLDEATVTHTVIHTSGGVYEFESRRVTNWLDDNAPTVPSSDKEPSTLHFKSIDAKPVDVPSTNSE